jgi:ornithine cyclodeaminase/alanine dehydrogenase-like protein (mu-crystallin family)
MLILSNEDVERVLTMPMTLDALRDAYRDLGNGIAVNRPRSDTLVPGTQPGSMYALKSMDGIVPREGVAAIRINSDVVHWPTQPGGVRREKIPLAPGKRWVGVIELFSVEDGRLLAIFPDGVLQRMRVAATNGLGVDYLARKDASVVGLLGAGWQAGSQVMAVCHVRGISKIRVYSPTRERREAFADEWSEKQGVQIEPVESAEQAVKGADIVLCATNALEPIFFERWLADGMHISNVRDHEIEKAAFDACDLVVINTRKGQPDHYVAGARLEDLPEHTRGYGVLQNALPWDRYTLLSDVVAGRAPGRTDDRQKTCFSNNLGLGFQFAAVGAQVLRKARERGLGHELPDDWFTETVHP